MSDLCSRQNSCLVVALLALWWVLGVRALGTNYVHDGKTTYCWKIPKPFKPSQLTPQDAVDAVAGDGCPLVMTVSLSKDSYQVLENVSVTWKVVANFSSKGNRLQQAKLFWAQEPTTGAIAQIVHSNVHSCEYGTGCDPFRDGEKFTDKTPNQVANFTDNSVAFHAKELVFQDPGDYSVLAHLILPDESPFTRYDYAVYTRVHIDPLNTQTQQQQNPSSNSNKPTSDGNASNNNQMVVIVAIIGGVVVVLGILAVVAVWLKRRHESRRNFDDQGTVASSMFTGIPPVAAVGVVDDNDDKDTVMFDSPTSGWSVPPGNRGRITCGNQSNFGSRSTGLTQGSSSMTSSSDHLSLGLSSMSHSSSSIPSLPVSMPMRGRSIQYQQVDNRNVDIEL